MTGFRSSKLAWQCNRSGCYIESLPCWDDIIACFPRNICPTDIDGMVEVSGHLLYIEQKTEGKSLPDGQRYALLEASRREASTVIVLRDTPVADLEYLILGRGQSWKPCTRQWILDWFRSWAEYADANPFRPRVQARAEQLRQLADEDCRICEVPFRVGHVPSDKICCSCRSALPEGGAA